MMDASVQNFLYRNPQFYELAYPEPNDETPMMCRRMFSRYLATPPRSILDIGCGTGRDLDSLSRECPDCWGIDYLLEMVEFARATRPHLHVEVGDMRTLRLGRTFDVILCMGSAFMYALTNTDVARVLDTFVAHSHPGTLLILDINNAASYLGGEHFKQTAELRVSWPGFSALARSTYNFDRRRHVLVRRRTWTIDGQGEVEDFCEYRMFFPAELEHLLTGHRFKTRGMFDNKELHETDLSGSRLYVASVFRAEPEQENLQLIQPTETSREEFLVFRAEFPLNEDVPGLASMKTGDFDADVRNALNHAKGIGLADGWVPAHTFWLVRNERTIVGVLQIRHTLTPFLEAEGGHIGYSVRPSERGKGYATHMLGMALDEARRLGLKRVLITCDRRNVASARVIQKNGGRLENEIVSCLPGREFTQRYWIELNSERKVTP